MTIRKKCFSSPEFAGAVQHGSARSPSCKNLTVSSSTTRPKRNASLRRVEQIAVYTDRYELALLRPLRLDVLNPQELK